jgi:hypothetical protein
MKFLTDLLPHVFVWCLIAAGSVFLLFMILGGLQIVGEFLFTLFYPIYGITLKPVIWAVTTAFGTRCPQCGGFFKKQFVRDEIVEEKESLQTLNRVDSGVLYSNRLFAPNQGFEVTRQEQVSVVNQTIRHHWECKNPTCGHQWQTEEFLEIEGSLDK